MEGFQEKKETIKAEPFKNIINKVPLKYYNKQDEKRKHEIGNAKDLEWRHRSNSRT